MQKTSTIKLRGSISVMLRSRNGDTNLPPELYATIRQPLLDRILPRVQNRRDVAEDIIQVTLLKIHLLQSEAPRLSGGKFWQWVLNIAGYEIRKSRTADSHTWTAHDVSACQPRASHEVPPLAAALDLLATYEHALDPVVRDIMRKYVDDAMTTEEIAEAYYLTKPAISHRLEKGFLILRDLVLTDNAASASRVQGWKNTATQLMTPIHSAPGLSPEVIAALAFLDVMVVWEIVTQKNYITKRIKDKRAQCEIQGLLTTLGLEFGMLLPAGAYPWNLRRGR